MEDIAERNKLKMTIREGDYSEEIECADDVVQALRQIMTFSGVSEEVALMQAVANEKFLQDIEDSGHKLLIMQKKRFGGKQMRYLVRKPSEAPRSDHGGHPRAVVRARGTLARIIAGPSYQLRAERLL